MDLMTIQDKLAHNQYMKAEEFWADFKLMFNNCYNFNPSATTVWCVDLSGGVGRPLISIKFQLTVAVQGLRQRARKGVRQKVAATSHCRGN
jgi:Bromodomain